LTPKILYVAYWGAAEPLGQSLVLPAVKRLSSSGCRMDLVTFEKPADLRNRPEVERIARELEQAGVVWHPLIYHKRPKWPATLYDVARGVAKGVAVSWRNRPEIVHGRTFVGGVIGWLISAFAGVQFIFHNEGFYPDEQVDGGVWRFGSLAHRLARSVEQWLYNRAAGIIVLSRRARAQVEGCLGRAAGAKPIAVVPSCVDLDGFAWRGPIEWRAGSELRLVYVGSIGARYVFERVGELVAVALERGLAVRLRVLTPADPALVGAILSRCGVPRDAWSVARVAYSDMPRELASQHAGMMVLTQGLSEHGCSPTKVGEYWAVGLPVLITPNISDTEEIFGSERVGVVIRGAPPLCYEKALEELFELLRDPELAHRCRRAAERHYGLNMAVEQQRELYSRLLSGAG